jgi:uncharacterized protein
LDSFFKLNLNNKQKNISIGFGGGEPLLNFSLIKKIVEYTNRKMHPHKRVDFYITTNGSLINDEIALFISQNFKQVGVSMDGSKSGNDSVRKYANGKGTSIDILKGLKILLKYISPNKVVISTTLSRGNFNGVNKSFLRKIKKLNLKKISLEPDLIDLIDLDYNKVCNKVFNLYKYGREIDLVIDGYWKKPFTCLISENIPIGACIPIRGESISITPKGSVKPCIYSKEEFSFDKLENILHLPGYKEFLIDKWIGNIKECSGCEIEGICLGGCYLSRIMPDKRVFDYRCALYKRLFHLIILDFLQENY